jgi:hypothetical protein
MCRGAVSGGTGDDHMRSSADTAWERRRRRAQIVVAVIVMAGAIAVRGIFVNPARAGHRTLHGAMAQIAS